MWCTQHKRELKMLNVEAVLSHAAEKILREIINYKDSNGVESSCGSGAKETKIKRRKTLQEWMDFSDEELKIVNEIEAKPGMKAEQIIAYMSVNNTAGVGVTCEANTTKVLLANLVKRKVITASTTQGYMLNNAAPPPPPSLSPQ